MDALRRLVTGLVEKAEMAESRLVKLEAENAALREENAALRLDNTRLRVENQLLRDEIAQLKNLPPRPPFRPSGMDKATDPKPEGEAPRKKPRGVKRDMDRISREQILTATVPSGSRFPSMVSRAIRPSKLIVPPETLRLVTTVKTCRKLGVSFYHFRGHRLEIAGKTVPPLATLVLARA